MTFKHSKFEESAVMRSLEKLAVQKGLVKPEEIKKTANKKTDLNPTEDFTTNILKLCKGLREAGLDNLAEDLEKNYLLHKKAEKELYDVCGETGEDLVRQFHPEGSHQLEGVIGDSLVEDIIENQLNHLLMEHSVDIQSFFHN